MYHCKQCGAKFSSFRVPGQCPVCKTIAIVRCGRCGRTADAGSFLAGKKCPHCGEPIAVSPQGRKVPLWVGLIPVCVALAVMVSVGMAYLRQRKIPVEARSPIAIALDHELARPSSGPPAAAPVHLQDQDDDQAILELTRAIGLNPQRAELYVDRGVAHMARQNLDAAIADFSEAIRLDSGLVAAYRNRGQAYAKKGTEEDMDRCRADLAKARTLSGG